MNTTEFLKNPLTAAIRALAMDGVQQANSGHPGMPMGMAEIAEVLWRRFLRHNPNNPDWLNRDRFVLSNGHGSMLLYALLHLTGYDVSAEDLKSFRQLHAKTAGHPEYGMVPGVETTTGPLGQGVSNAVGLALAEKILAAEFNTSEFNVIDHYSYAFVGDGCLMEGVSHEACSLAGTWGLGKLIVFYDDNDISIDGHVRGWFTDNTVQRFASYGWQVIANVDGHDSQALEQALRAAQTEQAKPTLICCKTVIGMGSPNKAGGHDVHGAPLGAEEIAATRQAMDWQAPPFVVPETVASQWDAREKGQALEQAWQAQMDAYAAKYPEKAQALNRRLAGTLPENWQAHCQTVYETLSKEAKTVATRKASQMAIEQLAPLLPELVGGSADLAGSNLTLWSGSKAVADAMPAGANYIHYGVREFAMTAIANGLALYGGLIPYTATFLVFSDYARNAIRMAALMKQRHIMVYTHDSIGLGEDGPTHQPVEHANSLRLLPNLDVWRPADVTETFVAWQCAVERQDGPSALLLSRQNLPALTHHIPAEVVGRGGYVLQAAAGRTQVVLLATGSELMIAEQAYQQLTAQNVAVQLVSMPSTSVFDRQPESWRNTVLPQGVPVVIIEAGTTGLWYKYLTAGGAVLGIDRYGESAPANELFEFFGLTVDKMVAAALKWV